MNSDFTDSNGLSQQQQQQEQQDQTMKQFENEDPANGGNDSAADDSDTEKPAKRSGRRKIKIEYIEDKNRRHITFSKRKAGIMKKAYELSTLTGTQVLLLVVSETGLVYTFTTVKLQPIVTKPEGKNLIQACLNAPDPMPIEPAAGDASYSNTSPQIKDDKQVYDDAKTEPQQPQLSSQQQQPQQTSQQQQQAGYNNAAGAYQPTYSQPQQQPQQSTDSTAGAGAPAGYNGHPGYLNTTGALPTGYQPTGTTPGNNAAAAAAAAATAAGYPPMQHQSTAGFYSNQQQHYLNQQQQSQQQPQQQLPYWQQATSNLSRQNQSPIIDNATARTD